MREKIAEAKVGCADLNITKIFSVTGKSQQRGTFNKARVANVSFVLCFFREVFCGFLSYSSHVYDLP